MRKGHFITFEGPEKSGKSTQADLLSVYLRARGRKVLFLREPGSTAIGEKIRRILLDKKNVRMSMATEMMLYMAARAQLVEEVIRPFLSRGGIVLCDRFLDSTVAYQGYGAGLDAGWIRRCGQFATGGLTPDLTLLLDFWKSPVHLKNDKRPDRIEMRSRAFHGRVRRGYFQMARQEPRRIKIIRVRDDIAETQRVIRETVESCLFKGLSGKKRPSGC
jgi:dTMP kinase